MYVRRRMANYRCAMNVVIMGAKDAASGVLYVRGKDVGILSVVIAITVIHFSPKFSVGKFGRVSGVASSFLMGLVLQSRSSALFFSCTGPCRFEQHSL